MKKLIAAVVLAVSAVAGSAYACDQQQNVCVQEVQAVYAQPVVAYQYAVPVQAFVQHQNFVQQDYYPQQVVVQKQRVVVRNRVNLFDNFRLRVDNFRARQRVVVQRNVIKQNVVRQKVVRQRVKVQVQTY